MAVLPTVRLLIPCDEARFDLADERWTVHHPWGPAVMLPPKARFPFRLTDAWVYVQFTDGVGPLDLYVELLQVQEHGSERWVGYSDVTRLDLPGGNPWVAFDTAFRLKRMPFRSAGDYKFRVVAEADDGFRPLDGHTATVRVLDGGKL